MNIVRPNTSLFHSSFRSIIISIFLALNLVLAVKASADNPPPTEVINSFHQVFPTVKKCKWNNTGIKNKEFKAIFKMNNKLMAGYFDAQGKLIETERLIPNNSLPEKVLNSLSIQYEEYKIINALEILQDNKIVSYEIMIKSSGVKSSVVLSKDGFFTAR